MTPQTLREAIGCTRALAEQYADPITVACAFYSIDTPKRLAAFLAQIGHESGSLKFTTEIWGPTPAQSRYEGRADLGNVQPGDGAKFKGHGLIQTTGRYNHARVRDRLRERFQDVPDFEADPDALSQPQWAALSAADYWDDKGLNALADVGDFERITRRINGGLNGQADRLARWERAARALSAPATETITVAPDGSAAPTQEPPMVAPIIAAAAPFLWSLASSLIDVFTPLAREKITKEVARHSDSPMVAEQIATSVIEAAKQMTGKPDPIEAVVAAKADPVIVQQIQDSTLEDMAKLAPMLEKIAEWDKEAWSAEEVSRDAAAERRKLDEYDMAKPLLLGSMGVVAVLILFVGAVAIAQLVMTGEIKTEIWAAMTGLIGWATAKAGSLYDYRFGTSRSSGAKDVVIGELSKRKPN